MSDYNGQFPLKSKQSYESTTYLGAKTKPNYASQTLKTNSSVKHTNAVISKRNNVKTKTQLPFFSKPKQQDTSTNANLTEMENSKPFSTNESQTGLPYYPRQGDRSISPEPPLTSVNEYYIRKTAKPLQKSSQDYFLKTKLNNTNPMNNTTSGSLANNRTMAPKRTNRNKGRLIYAQESANVTQKVQTGRQRAKDLQEKTLHFSHQIPGTERTPSFQVGPNEYNKFNMAVIQGL